MDIAEPAQCVLGVASGTALTPEMAMSSALLSVAKYSGDAETELVSSVTWVRGLQAKMAVWVSDYRPDFFRSVILRSVTGEALEHLRQCEADTPEAMLKALTERFTQRCFQVALYNRVSDGSAFKGVTRDEIIPRLAGFAREFADNPVCIHALAVATKKLLPDEWRALRVSPDVVSFDRYQELLQTLETHMLQRDWHRARRQRERRLPDRGSPQPEH